MNIETAIKVTHLSKVYQLRQSKIDEDGNSTSEHWALKDVSFEIKKGESVGIIGPNGSGKSTLLKILAGVVKPTSGKISIVGKVASILDIGAGFHPELSGRENVFLNGQIHGFTKKEIESKFDEIVIFSEIGNFIDEPVKNYSNGMYLRLAFSIMVHLDFDVYLFDEVMSVGDMGFILKSKEKINSLKLLNKTVIVVSHSIQEIQGQEKFIHLENGILLDFSSKKDIITRYSEKSILNNNHVIFTKNAIVTDFSRYPLSTLVKLLKVELLQEGDVDFVSDKEFRLNIKFEKLNDKEKIDLFLLGHDILGNTLFMTTPILHKKSTIIEKGIYNASCVLPKNIFGIQVYYFDLLLINDSTIENITQFNYQIKYEQIQLKAISYERIITFKSKFKNEFYEITNFDLNAFPGLLLDFNWDYIS